MTHHVARSLCLIVVLAVAIPAVSSAIGEARVSCIGARLEYYEGRREIAKERREVRKAVRNADSRKEAKKAIRQGVKEIAREKREQRREIMRELRPWC